MTAKEAPDPTVARIVAANLDLVERLIRQTRRHHHYLADEFRSRANWKLFVAARQIAPLGLPPERERRYVVRAILISFVQVGRDFSRCGRTLSPLAVGEEGWREPGSREVAPDVMAELRESLALGLIEPPPERRRLTRDENSQLRAMIVADPARNNCAIARDFFAATRIRIHGSAVSYNRKRLGLPPTGVTGGAHLHRRHLRR